MTSLQGILQIEGDSTLKKFSSKSTQLQITLHADPEPKQPEDFFKAKVRDLTLTVAVADFKSDSETLDEHMAEALKADKFPLIRGSLKKYEIVGQEDSGARRIRATVELSVAGATRTVPIDAIAEVEPKKIRVQGEKLLRMTDFGIEPPTMLLGTLKTKDEINVRFELTFNVD